MEDEEVEAGKEESQQVLRILEALKQASHDLQTNPSSKSSDSDSSPAIKVLLDLESEADAILSGDPNLTNLSNHLSNLKTLINTLQNNTHRRLGLKSFLTRRFKSHEISRVAGSIESEIQAWIDRETIENLTRALQKSNDEGEVISLIEVFTSRISQGFDRELQDSILKSKVFSELQSVLCSSSRFSKKVREKSASAISESIKFNKDVFVGQVLLGQTIRALVSLAAAPSLKVLCSLIKSIKSPFVDEIESNGEIPKIICFLTFEDISIRTMAFKCVLTIGYFGRKEAIEAMMKEGLVEKLMELQRSDSGKENHQNPFAGCVGRFAVQVEVGVGLRQREKRAFKQEILKRVRDSSVSDAEAASILTEVLWGASP